jgi:hypothetical protein
LILGKKTCNSFIIRAFTKKSDRQQKKGEKQKKENISEEKQKIQMFLYLFAVFPWLILVAYLLFMHLEL